MISTRRGDVSVLGRDGDVEIASQHGDVAASDVNGKVNLNLSGGSARISDISGDVSVQGRADDISVADVKGAAQLNGEFDSIKLGKVAGAVGFKSARTDMEFSRLNGDLDMDSGDLRASDLIGPFRLHTRSKDVRLNGVEWQRPTGERKRRCRNSHEQAGQHTAEQPQQRRPDLPSRQGQFPGGRPLSRRRNRI